MAALDVFALSVLALGLGALGLSVVYEGTRITAASGRTALTRRRIQAKADELKELNARIEDTKSRTDLQQATLDRLIADRARLTGMIRSLKASKVEMIHELGELDGPALLFECDLRTAPDFNRLDQRRMVFAREIWDRRNIAHVWADTPDAAMAAVQRAFNLRSGLLPGRLQRSAPAAETAVETGMEIGAEMGA
ncbi:hypothetical protein [Azospirillum canadense]|uniref:hypothetical protein n=1 Tax=Azospirillum canadense TaxID=403962 RepID=UPI002226A646|nr:hypothetical protein [Azospirillum canadense]MCW2236560.1 hypothetical protein [Azospirillum canadense]